jgi:fumarate hydratase subunit alpha
VPPRPNTVDLSRHTNPGDNTGRGVPIINWEITSGDSLKIHMAPKGGGSEAFAKLAMPPPGRVLESLPEIVIDAILDANGKPCSPTIIGVGVGGGADEALHIAKKAC